MSPSGISSSTIPRSSHFLIASAVFFASRRKPCRIFSGTKYNAPSAPRIKAPLPSPLGFAIVGLLRLLRDNFGGPYREELTASSDRSRNNPPQALAGNAHSASRPRAAAAQTSGRNADRPIPA